MRKYSSNVTHLPIIEEDSNEVAITTHQTSTESTKSKRSSRKHISSKIKDYLSSVPRLVSYNVNISRELPVSVVRGSLCEKRCSHTSSSPADNTEKWQVCPLCSNPSFNKASVTLDSHRSGGMTTVYSCIRRFYGVWTTVLIIWVISLVLISDIQFYGRKHSPSFGNASYRATSENSTSHYLRESINDVDVSPPDAVQVGVYYEPLCPDSKNFVRLQLAPTMAKIGDKIDLSLVPYGKATTSGSGTSFTFQCQHGPTECLGNKVHACVVKHVPDTSVQIKIVSCMINDNRKPTKIARKCVPRYAGEDAFAPIYKCFTTSEGDVLLNEMGKLTGKVAPRLSFVPTVTINGSDDDLFTVLGNFLSAVCKKIKGPLPAACL